MGAEEITYRDAHSLPLSLLFSVSRAHAVFRSDGGIDTAARRVRYEHDLRPYFANNEAQSGRPGGTFPYAVVVKGNETAYVSSDRDREILFRFYLAEDDKERICRDLGLTAVHFNRVLFRARERFRELYRKWTAARGLDPPR